MAIFYRKERFEPLEFEHFWLSDTPNVIGSTSWGNTNRRMATWVRFKDRRTSRELYVWNTHLDHAVQVAREKGAALIRQRMETLGTTIPIVLLGDFNATAGANKAYDILIGGQFLSDAWKAAAERRGDAVNSFHDFRGPTPGDRMLAAQLFGTTGVAVVLLLVFAMDTPRLLDLALVFAVLAAVVGIAFALRGWVEPKSNREERHEP